MTRRKLTDDEWIALFDREAAGERRADLVREHDISLALLVVAARRLKRRKRDTGAPDHRRRPPGGWPPGHVNPQGPGLTTEDWDAAMQAWMNGEGGVSVGRRLGVTQGAVAGEAFRRGLRRCDRIDAAPAPRQARPVADTAQPFDDQPGPPHKLRPAQTPPGGDWRTWLFLGGRGAGKTLAGAEWLADQVKLLGCGGRVALIGPTLHDVREVMIEGVSGLRSLPRWTRRDRPVYQPSRRRLYFENGCVAYAFSAEDPDSLRGPQFSAAWADELCAWPAHGARGAAETLAMLRMGLRLPLVDGGEGRGARVEGRSELAAEPSPSPPDPRPSTLIAPRLMVTTTPKPTRTLIRLRDEPTCVLTHAPTSDNAANLSPGFIDDLKALYGGTRREAQELDGQIVDLDGALFTAEMMRAARRIEPDLALPSPLAGEGGPEGRMRGLTDACPIPRKSSRRGDPSSVSLREPPSPARGEGRYDRIILALDPPATAGGDACGLIAAARRTRADGRTEAVILADRSQAGLSPIQWATRALALAREVGAQVIVAEVNQGGDMVRQVLTAAGVDIPIRPVRATTSKRARAEPVAALYEQGRVRHLGDLAALEEELMLIGGEMEGSSSLDRADALVWAVTHLLIDGRGEGPRVSRL